MFTGRREEITQVAKALADDRQAVVLAGPAGIGKSTLGRHVVDSTWTGHQPSGVWLTSGGLASLRWAPFILYRRILGDRVRDMPDLVAAQVLRLEPAGLLLDDLQWADDLSLEVTANLVGRLPLLVTVRTGDAEAERTLAALDLVGFHRIDLAPLDDESSRRLVQNVHPHLDAAEQARILRQAAGNPLLLGELAAGHHATPTLVRALQTRLGELPADVREAMCRLSVLGRPADTDLLGPGASGLVEAGLATDVNGQIEVRHALLAEVVVHELGDDATSIRMALADQVSPQEAAFLLVPTGDRARIRAAALRGANTAKSGRVRAELWALAVDAAPEGDLDAVLRLDTARLFSRVGAPDRALDVCRPEGVDELPAVDRGSLRAASAEAYWLLGRVQEFQAAIEAALDDLAGTRTPMEVEALAGSTLIDTRINFAGGPALERAQAAVALAEEVGASRAFAMHRLAAVLQSVGDPTYVAVERQALAEATKDGDGFLELDAARAVVLASWMNESARAAIDQIEPLVAAGPSPDLEGHWLAFTAMAPFFAYLAGVSRAEIVDRWRPILQEQLMFRNRTFARAAVGVSLAELGRHGEASVVLERIGEDDSDPQLRAVGVWSMAMAAWCAGRSEEVVEAAATAEAIGIGDYPPVARARLLADYALRDLGEVSTSSEPRPMVPAWSASPIEWQALRADRRGEFDVAVQRFDEAAVAWAPHDHSAMLRCRWAAGDAARRAGRHDAADRLTALEHDAHQVGNLALASRVRRSLRDIGVHRSSARGATNMGLTAREVAVLERVGDGLTSVAIAAELHVSASTVDSLVRSAVQRLGAANRRSAAAQLRAMKDADHP
ncbi:MAG: LuxR C-terminal-related transcriptional regulator [Aquihabitans sp.]